ncbi:MlaD family protein [Leptobacterium sp. I13]|uniref:MlaD family protein n=1 Tax=Leptobacterium meishanense TaxID=3128904 RepID=UPI0030EDEFCE
MKLSREIKTAIIVLGGILLFVLGFSYLKSNSVFQSYRTYYVIYNHVGGLAPGTPVMINGFNVGKIKDIRFLDEKGRLLVTFNIEDEFEFSKNSKAELFDTGIIGGKSIQVIPVFDDSRIAQSGDTLISSVKPGLTELVTQKLTPLQEQLGNMLTNADSLLGNINQIMDAETKQNIRGSIGELNRTIANFRKASEAIGGIVTDNEEKLRNTLDNVENVSANLSKVSDSLSEANLGATIKKLETTITSFNKILNEIEKGEGSLGKLVNDKKLYDNLSGASQELGLLLEDMRLNPKRYVHFSLFGKKPKPYEPPSDTKENN